MTASPLSLTLLLLTFKQKPTASYISAIFRIILFYFDLPLGESFSFPDLLSAADSVFLGGLLSTADSAFLGGLLSTAGSAFLGLLSVEEGASTFGLFLVSGSSVTVVFFLDNDLISQSFRKLNLDFSSEFDPVIFIFCV